VLFSLVAAVAIATHGSACARAVQPTRLVIDGYLYAVVRAPGQHFLFGSSGPPVETVPDALRLVRALGFTGTDAKLFDYLEKRNGIPGGRYEDAGSISNFDLTCGATYTATAVVRSRGGSIVATRFWLQQGTTHVTRAFCMPEQWVPAGARVSVRFHVPLPSSAPVFTIDWNGDGKIDSLGPFRAGGARFPVSDRC